MNLALQSILQWVLIYTFYVAPSIEGTYLTVWKAFFDAGQSAKDRGRYDEAARLYEVAVKLAVPIKDKGEREASSLNGLAWICNLQNRNNEGVELAKRALAIDERRGGAFDSAVSRDLNTLASIYQNQGKYAAAEPIYRRIILIKESGGESETANFAGILTNLMVVYRSQSKFVEAETVGKRAIAVYEKGVGSKPLDLANTLNNLANVYFSQGKYVEAIPLYERSLSIREKTLGTEHPGVALALHNLANVRLNQGNYEVALPNYERALAIREKAMGPNHIEVASSLNGLGNVLLSQGHFSEAMPLYQRALTIFENAKSADQSSQAMVLGNLSRVSLGLNQYAEAEAYERRAMRIREKDVADASLVAVCLDTLAEIHYAQGFRSKGDVAFLRARKIHRQVIRTGNARSADPIFERAHEYFKKGHFHEAATMYRRAWNLFEIGMGPDDPHVAQAIESYASSLKELDRHLAADGFAEQAKKLRERQQPKPPLRDSVVDEGAVK